MATTNKKPPVKKAAAPKKAAKSSQPKDDGLLGDLFLDAIKDIYWAEKNLLKALPRMHKAATTQELKDAIEDHTGQTERQAQRLEQVFKILGKKAQAKKCDAMEGLIKEGQSIIEETEKGTITRDVGIIMAAQKVEHYEIATYGGLVTLAKTLGHDDISTILAETLEEEKETDAGLSAIAESGINLDAKAEG